MGKRERPEQLRLGLNELVVLDNRTSSSPVATSEFAERARQVASVLADDVELHTLRRVPALDFPEELADWKRLYESLPTPEKSYLIHSIGHIHFKALFRDRATINTVGQLREYVSRDHPAGGEVTIAFLRIAFGVR